MVSYALEQAERLISHARDKKIGHNLAWDPLYDKALHNCACIPLYFAHFQYIFLRRFQKFSDVYEF